MVGALNEYEWDRGRDGLVTLADELRLPLLQIKMLAESLQSDPEERRQINQIIAEATKLIDGLLMCNDVARGQLQLTLQPVGVGALIDDIANDLSSLGSMYDRQIITRISHHSAPVMAHRQLIKAALRQVGDMFIRSARGMNVDRVHIVSRSSVRGTTIGFFADGLGISQSALDEARQLIAKARQPLHGFLRGSGVQLLVADTLLGMIAEPLSVQKHHDKRGLVTHLMPSRQLQLLGG